MAFALASMTASGRAQDTFPHDPQLRIEPGMHTAPIESIGVSADGRLLATASHDRTVRLWSLPDGKLIRTLRVPIGPGHQSKVFAVALAPDGRWLAAGGNTSYVYIFDTGTGAVTATLMTLDSIVSLAV